MSLFNFDYRSRWGETPHTPRPSRTSRLVLAGAALALAGGVIGTGCGGIDVSTEDGFCAALAEADCSYAIVQACYGSSDASMQADVDACIQARRQPSKCNPARLPYHAEFADACIAQHQTVFANATIDGKSWASVSEACLSALNRGGQAGSTCTADHDCDVGYGGLRCMLRVGGKGTCQVPKPVMGGDSCKAPAAQCPEDKYCNADFFCVVKPSNTDACGAGQPCGDGFRCNGELEKCEPQLPNGSDCSRDSDCTGGFCLDTATGKQCAASYVFSFGATTCSDFKR